MIGKCTRCKLVYDWKPSGVLPRSLDQAVCANCGAALTRTTYLNQFTRATRPPDCAQDENASTDISDWT